MRSATWRSGADLGGVFAVGDVAEVVQGLDPPVAADQPTSWAGVSWMTLRLVMAWTVTA
jgi:hypothetical protein